MKKLKSKVLKKTFYKIYGITLRKYLTANLPSSNHLQNELKTKDKIIDQLLKSFSSLTNFELESKNNIMHKLLDETNDEEKKKQIQRQNDINTKSDIADNKSDEKYSNKKTKEHAERNKANNSPNNTESRDVKPKKK